MTADQVEGSEFPIRHRGPMKPDVEEKKIGCIDPGAIVAINGMQPYHRGNGYTSDPLWQIHELNRIDKHRSLTVCAAETRKEGVRQIGFLVDAEIVRAIQYGVASPALDLKLNAVLFRWAGVVHAPRADMGLKPQLALEVVFGQGEPIAGEPVVPTLRALCDHVGNVVVPALAKFL